MVICWLQVLQKGGSVSLRRYYLCDLGVSDSKSSHSWNILKTEKMLQFGTKSPKEVNHLRWKLIADHNE